ncbi:class I SAM-dependent methyltransferase [Hydrogenophaga sp.]|uniref:class I SAM-dependent methyltransferase n=1 Tax=Hydrogenophaga sp. TaxID=1904254 RepID=UPI0025C60A2A|nr:class I SAM-dependent methyltransferase [Hydrogenophaga sp.]
MQHEGVADWSFNTAPGHWHYWRCTVCETLYLNPRPTPQSIGRAYASYYTHSGQGTHSMFQSWRQRWKNERLSERFDRNIEPRLNLPRLFRSSIAKRAQRIALPFGWQELADLPPGRLMDVGCGSGATLSLALQLGWKAEGLEMDPEAVRAAQAAGLSVGDGGYERLSQSPSSFDCVHCSHVIEHVFDPRDLLRVVFAALKPGGTLILATPNALSDVHLHFGRYWRGLEAPRHLMIFSESTLSGLLMEQGFVVDSRCDQQLETIRESARIANGNKRIRSQDRAQARQLRQSLDRTPHGQDFIKLVAHKP